MTATTNNDAPSSRPGSKASILARGATPRGEEVPVKNDKSQAGTHPTLGVSV